MFASGSLYSIVIADILAKAANEIDVDLDEMLEGEIRIGSSAGGRSVLGAGTQSTAPSSWATG